MLPTDFIERIKEANDIVEVISERLSLTRHGANYIGVCPFHADRSPSLTVSPTRQMYKCFACGEGGDVIKFVERHDSLTFFEACQWLARRAHIEMPSQTALTDDERQRIREREALVVKTSHEQTDFTQAIGCQAFIDYLAERGIKPETAAKFGLGYAENGFFRGRITYPFYSLSGIVIGHTGRATAWNKESNFPKYKNSAESDLFHKDSVLFGIHQAKRAIAEANSVYLVEGQNDVISMHQSGIENVVCGSGTAFSERQARLLRRFCANVVLMYDGDSAGEKATLKTIRVLLAEGLSVKVVTLPEGEDPDTYARYCATDTDLSVRLYNLQRSWFTYVQKIYPFVADSDQYAANVRAICEFVATVPDELKRRQLIEELGEKYHIGEKELKRLIKPAPKTDTWQDGFYGLDEAKELLDDDTHRGTLTFDEQHFIECVDDEPIIFYKGKAKKHALQLLRQTFNEFVVDAVDMQFDLDEDPRLQVLTAMHREGFKIIVEAENEDNELRTHYFTDWYVKGYADYSATLDSSSKSECVRRCIDVIAYTEATMRTMNASTYASLLGLKMTAYNDLLKPILISRRDKAELEKQRGTLESNIYDFDPNELPAYVTENETIAKVFQSYGFYPLLKRESKQPCAYMFKNDKGNGYTRVSDFYMTPLLHIYSNEDVNNKRVIQLSHIHFGDKYVEWPSSILANLNEVNKKLINAGAYNYTGTLLQFKTIWQDMSYNFTKCTELKTFGQQPEGFWAFTNAIYHKVDGVSRIDYVNELGVTTHDGTNFYSPAFSKIFLDERRDIDQYEQDRYFIYKEVPDDKRIDFAEWARLMNEVYKINDNGKFAVLFDILTCFRDFIYEQKKFFTTLFFIGPTGSGKSQIAYSMRSLFMSPDAPVFNLNSGTDAAFFMTLERNRNVLAIMEEYNDANISQAKFQGLKSAILDGEGKIKVKDMATKQLDSSKINAVPLPLGQEAPQQDDGSLANRSILCDVPYKPKGEFSPEEVAIFDNLKEHERIGLSNVLIEILDIRPIVKKHFIEIFNEELKKIKENVNANITNTEGLTRVTNSVTMLVTMARLIEKYTSLRLPFTYSEFFQLGCDKIVKQMATISVVNKLSNYFSAIGFLITQGSIVIGRELKVSTMKLGELKVKRSGNKIETVKLPDADTKLLFLHFESIYPLYERVAGKSALSQQSLRAYFESHAAYIGQSKSTRFAWKEKRDEPHEITDADGTKKYIPAQVMKAMQNISSAYVFNYNTLVELADVDFERIDNAPSQQEDDTPPSPTDDNDNELPF